MNSLIGWIVVGAIAGWLTGKIMKGKGFGLFANVFLGLVGAVIGGWIFGFLGLHAYGFIGSLTCATVGAIAIVAIARLFAGGGS
ncbi:MAG: GlsB/YeaQ/YmgE family stress response membrane protein [Acidobacteria bacterium]|nr:GlsB/YeaQ/YmgE family stress response membrane protein [Acidobacteriota bacterium]